MIQEIKTFYIKCDNCYESELVKTNTYNSIESKKFTIEQFTHGYDTAVKCDLCSYREGIYLWKTN